MTNEEFEALVGRLEVQARSNPARYRRRVIALAFAGYAYLGFVMTLLIALFVGRSSRSSISRRSA